MSLIEQRILVVASAEAVWPYVSEPMLIAKWNRAYRQMSVLSTKSTGVGARRRGVGGSGKSVVEEVTAWLDNIGYEYVVVDGPYASFRGRYRLQAIPEGTIVNWAVDYHLRGVFGGVRNLLSFRRQQENLMADSLRNLRKLIEANGLRLQSGEHARFAMQSGPSAEDRAARAPAYHGEPGALRPVTISDDDLPELPLASTVGGAKLETGSFVPSFAAEPGATARLEPQVEEDDTKPRPPTSLRETVSPNETADPAAPTVPISLVAPPSAPLPDTQTVNLPASPPPKTKAPTPPVTPPKPAPPAPDTLPERIPTGPVQVPAIPEPPVDQKRDSKEMSIWEVFGVERPSERAQAELQAVIASIQKRAVDPDSPEAQPTEPVMPVLPDRPVFPAINPVSSPGLPKPKRRKAAAPVRPLNRKKPLRQKVKVAVRRPRT